MDYNYNEILAALRKNSTKLYGWKYKVVLFYIQVGVIKREKLYVKKVQLRSY